MTPETFRACEQAGYDIRERAGHVWQAMHGTIPAKTGAPSTPSDLPALVAVSRYSPSTPTGVDHDEAPGILWSRLVDSMGYGPVILLGPRSTGDNGADSSADAGDAPEDLRWTGRRPTGKSPAGRSKVKGY